MSIHHVAAVLHDMPELRDRTAAFVLAVIAESADVRTGWTFDFSVREIAGYARQSLRGARDRLRFLESNAYVRTVTKGKAGRERLQFRVLFDRNGTRRPESELWPTPANPAGVSKTAPAKVAAPPANGAGPPAGNGNLLNNPLIGNPSSSVSIQRGAKSAAGENHKRRGEDSIRRAAALSDEELEEKAANGKLTAAEEYEREKRRRERPRSSSGPHRVAP